MRSTALVRFALAVASFPRLHATALVFGNDANMMVAGSNGLNAIAVGYDLTNAAIPSTFSTNFLVKGDGVSSSTPLNFANAPNTTIHLHRKRTTTNRW